MRIRAAEPADGPAIGALFAEEGGGPALDWVRPDLAQWWLVAEYHGEIVGAMQVAASQPTAYIGEAVVSKRLRGCGIVRTLWRFAEAALREQGCQRVAATLRGEPWWVEAVQTEGFQRHEGPVTLVSKEL
jgi:ribosomal protein S18 acetylase RimI-like enzyme